MIGLDIIRYFKKGKKAKRNGLTEEINSIRAITVIKNFISLSSNRFCYFIFSMSIFCTNGHIFMFFSAICTFVGEEQQLCWTLSEYDEHTKLQTYKHQIISPVCFISVCRQCLCLCTREEKLNVERLIFVQSHVVRFICGAFDLYVQS